MQRPTGASFVEDAVKGRNLRKRYVIRGGLSALLWLQGPSDSLVPPPTGLSRKENVVTPITEKSRIELAEGAAGSRRPRGICSCFPLGWCHSQVPPPLVETWCPSVAPDLSMHLSVT